MEAALSPPPPTVFDQVASLRIWVAAQRSQGHSIGLVPTMGALHPGHASLVERAVQEGHRVVVSIFVNPTQFNDSGDLARYPVTPEEDLGLLAATGAGAVFMPTVQEVYGEAGAGPVPHIDWGGPFRGHEADQRPGHFDGVVAVLERLFRAVEPDAAYFGEKDLQQLAVVRVLVGRRFPGLKVVGCPIVREPDGLAMSSRNRRLGAEARGQALAIPRELFRLAEEVGRGEAPTTALARARQRLASAPGVHVFYFDVVDPEDWSVPALDSFAATPPTPAFAIVAAEVGGVRLLDNHRIR